MANLQDIIPAVFTGAGGQRLTPEQIAQRQAIAQSLIGRATDTRPDAGGWASVITKGLLGYQSGAGQREADAAIKTNAEASQANIKAMLAGIGGGAGSVGGAYPAAVAGEASPTGGVATGTIPASYNIGANDDAIRKGIIETAQAIGADPVDLATAISYETGGTFNPTKAGPTTQWGQHRGLIQFGEPQAKQYGVDWNDPIGSQLGANGAIANYFRSSGFKPGMSGLDLYSTINAGAPGRYSASDANNGGAPGSVADKWNNQMRDHRAKALALMGVDSTDVTGDMLRGSPATAASAIEAIAPISGGGEIAFDQNNFDSRFGDVQTDALASVEPTATVAQQAQVSPAISEALLAQNDMALGGALSPSGRSGVAEALTGYFPPAPSMQSVPVQAQPQSMGGINPAIMQALSNPYASPQEQQIAGMMLQQQMQQQQAALQQQQAIQQRQAVAGSLNIDPALAGDTEAWKAAIEKANRNRNTVTVGNVVYDANTGQPVIEGQRDPTTDIQNYEYARQNGYGGSFADYQQEVKRAGATNVSTVVGGDSDEYRKEFEKSMGAATAKTFTDAMNAGDIARRNRINLDRISQLASSTPQGFEGATIRALGEYGIKTEGLDKVQAMESLISQMVPSQRPPGSGTISDADLALYKASLPRLINSPEGNSLILETLYAINDHDIAASDIAARVAAREITPTEARKLMRQIPNPFDDWREKVDVMSGDSPSVSKTKTGVTWSVN